MNRLPYRINIGFIGTQACKVYGGELLAWGFNDIEGEAWFELFRDHVLNCMGNKFLPIYRMADGEYRFLMGRKYNFHKRPLLRELISVSAEKIKIKNPNNWQTSWGESYSPKEIICLRNTLIRYIKEIAAKGYLACYINDNGLFAFTEYNKHIVPYFEKAEIPFTNNNYIPFHFVVGLLVNKGWQEFYKKRNILVVSGINQTVEENIHKSILDLGANKVEFLRISKTSSLTDTLELSRINRRIDLCLVAAGIGSANILYQLKDLNTVVLDIGGYINCYIDRSLSVHGGIFRYPLI